MIIVLVYKNQWPLKRGLILFTRPVVEPIIFRESPVNRALNSPFRRGVGLACLFAGRLWMQTPEYSCRMLSCGRIYRI